MKKIISLMILVTMAAASVFAYEPKKENVTVKRNGDIKYYEKTEPYKAKGDWTKDYKDYVCWVIRKGYTVEQCVEYNYKLLEESRRGYFFCMEKAYAGAEDFDINITKLLNKIDGTDMSPEEHARDSWVKAAKKDRDWAVTALPFVTEENFLRLTKVEMLVKMYAFIEECTK